MLATKYQVLLNREESALLDSMPKIQRFPVGSVFLALEAKACMTEHIKALPRLYDELNSSHSAIHGASDQAIAAGFAVVNLADQFISPERNKGAPTNRPVVTKLKQPAVTERTIAKLKEIPRRLHGGTNGFDALGIVVIELRNDGSPVRFVDASPAPAPLDPWHYEQMIHRISNLYAAKFAHT
jgi:hypothetical protein